MAQRRVEPLGVFGRYLYPRHFESAVSELRSTVGGLAAEEKAGMISYLRAAPLIFAVMGYSKDMLGERFTIPGGHSIASDGSYYWRLDTADYVEHYNVAISCGFVEHCRALNWIPPALSEKEIIAIYEFLEAVERSQLAEVGLGSTRNR